jgi:hypothetical protein
VIEDSAPSTRVAKVPERADNDTQPTTLGSEPRASLADWAKTVYVIGVLGCTAVLSEDHGLIRSFFMALGWPILIPPWIWGMFHGRFL